MESKIGLGREVDFQSTFVGIHEGCLLSDSLSSNTRTAYLSELGRFFHGNHTKKRLKPKFVDDFAFLTNSGSLALLKPSPHWTHSPVTAAPSRPPTTAMTAKAMKSTTATTTNSSARGQTRTPTLRTAKTIEISKPTAAVKTSTVTTVTPTRTSRDLADLSRMSLL